MHYESAEAMNKDNPSIRWSGKDPVVFRIKADVEDQPFFCSHTFVMSPLAAAMAPRGQKVTKGVRYFIDTAEGRLSVSMGVWMAVSDAINAFDGPLHGSQWKLTKSGEGIRTRYECHSAPEEKPVFRSRSTPIYVVIAYMPEGTTIDGGSSTVTKEFFEKDRPGPDWGPPGVFSLPRQVYQLANMVVRVEVATGKSEVLKNRWGPLPGDRVAPEVPVFYGDGHDDARAAGILRGKADFSSPGPNVYDDILRGMEAKAKVFKPAGGVDAFPDRGGGIVVRRPEQPKPSTQTCKCSMMDLLSVGHSDGCPEKKR